MYSTDLLILICMKLHAYMFKLSLLKYVAASTVLM